MDKNSSENKPCTYCDAEAIPGTYPPVCEEHKNVKKASENEEPSTLKELENSDD